jgi:membrane protein YqaA with SNARE-associated domain
VSHSVRHLLGILVQFGVFGLLFLSIADDSFLFLPVGVDLLTVVLVARHHSRFLLYVLAGAVGSAIGVLLLDLVCRKAGEEGLKRLVRPKLLGYLKERMEKNAAWVLVISCLAPPPFPFGASIAAASALQYPRPRLVGVVFAARLVRFSLVAWAAIKFGPRVLRIANSDQFIHVMIGFIALCLVGSVFEVIRWIRMGRSKT